MMSKTFDQPTNIAFNIPDFADKMLERFKITNNSRPIFPLTNTSWKNINSESQSIHNLSEQSYHTQIPSIQIPSNEYITAAPTSVPTSALVPDMVQNNNEMFDNETFDKEAFGNNNALVVKSADTIIPLSNCSSIKDKLNRFINLDDIVNDFKTNMDRKFLMYVLCAVLLSVGSLGYEYYMRKPIQSTVQTKVQKNKNKKLKRKN
jgi:hypothetical protein